MARTMTGQFHFFAADTIRRYEATDAAVALVGHEAIMECIEVGSRHETGTNGQADVDWYPIETGEQLVILRDQLGGRVVAFLGSEREAYFPSMPCPPC